MWGKERGERVLLVVGIVDERFIEMDVFMEGGCSR